MPINQPRKIAGLALLTLKKVSGQLCDSFTFGLLLPVGIVCLFWLVEVLQ